MNVNTTTFQGTFAPCFPRHWSAQWARLEPRMAWLRSLRSVRLDLAELVGQVRREAIAAESLLHGGGLPHYPALFPVGGEGEENLQVAKAAGSFHEPARAGMAPAPAIFSKAEGGTI